MRAGTYLGGVCPPAHYCPANSRFPVPCPANTQSASGSKDVYDCKVDAHPHALALRAEHTPRAQ